MQFTWHVYRRLKNNYPKDRQAAGDSFLLTVALSPAAVSSLTPSTHHNATVL